MKLYESDFKIPIKTKHINLIPYFKDHFNGLEKENKIPIRFVITETDNDFYHCELGFLSSKEYQNGNSIFSYKQRSGENTDQFNVVLLVPTGIGAEIGGHAGDATPVAKLIGESCDTLITHPNVVNASDINEMPDNGLYVEGSVITRLMMGMIGLQTVRSNRVMVIIDKHNNEMFTNAAINSVSGARAAYGFNCPRVVQLDPPINMKSIYSSSGRAGGTIDNLEGLFQALNNYKDEYDAVAVSSIVNVPLSYHMKYYKGRGKMINPWGGVEAILTHSISHLYNVPSAHSPMMESLEISNLDPGVIDPRMAAEVVSITFLQSVLKGLHKSPRIISDPDKTNNNNVITIEDVSCLVIPDGCVGLPTLAALEQGVTVIAVKENYNMMKNDLRALPWKHDQLYIVENYWEVSGVINALRAGITPESVRRPLSETKVVLNQTRASISAEKKFPKGDSKKPQDTRIL